MAKSTLLQRLLGTNKSPENFGSSNSSVSKVENKDKPIKDSSPLDALASLWQTVPELDENGNPVKAEIPKNLTNLLTIDPAKINEAASKLNFSSVITPEQLQAITAGGEEAQAAFIEALNGVSQQVFSQSLVANAALLQETLNKTDGIIDRKAVESIKRQNISDKITGSNELLAHPAVAPLVEVVKSNLTSKFPDATPQEISEATLEYISNFTQALSENPEDPNTTGETVTDWEAFAGLAKLPDEDSPG